MSSQTNPIRAVLGEVGAPPHITEADYIRQFSHSVGEASELNAMEVFLANEIFRQFKQVEFLQCRGRRAQFDNVHDYLVACFGDSDDKPDYLEDALGDIRECLTPADSEAVSQICEAVGLSWLELNAEALNFAGYRTDNFERDVDACHERIGKLQKMLNAASLTPAMHRRLEAQTRLIECELDAADLVVECKHVDGGQDEQSGAAASDARVKTP